jgi:hypothetical protein
MHKVAHFLFQVHQSYYLLLSASSSPTSHSLTTSTSTMDFIKNLASGNDNNAGNNNGSVANNQANTGNFGQSEGQPTEQKLQGSFLSGLTDKFNSAAGGGRESEKNEDYLDKGKIHRVLKAFFVSCVANHSPASTNYQVSILCKRNSSVKALRITSPLWSRPRTNKSPTLFGTSTAQQRVATFRSKTSRRHSIETLIEKGKEPHLSTVCCCERLLHSWKGPIAHLQEN